MDDTNVQQMLVERAKILALVAEKEGYKTALRKQVEAKIAEYIPQELKDELASIDAEFATSEMTDKAGELEKKIKDGVLSLGHTVKVEGVGMAIFNKGRVTWTTAGLEGFLVVYPELAQFRHVNDPYVTFR